MFRLHLSVGCIVAASALFFSPASQAQEAGFRTYNNARFGYTLQYPSALLIAKPEADNGDGRRFESRDRKVLLRAFGTYNANSQSISGKLSRVAADWRADGAQVTYQKSGDGWYAVSGFVGGDIFYEKALLRNGTFATIIWEYPKSYRQQLDTSVTRTVRSFRLGRTRSEAAPNTRPAVRSTIPHPRAVAPRPAPAQSHTATAPTKLAVQAAPKKVAATRNASKSEAQQAAPPRATSSRGY